MAAPPGASRHERSRGFYRALRGRLSAAAERTFELNTPRKDGTTLRDHLISANQQRGGVLSAELEVDIPTEGQSLWELFQTLCHSRRSGMAAQAFTQVDIQAWSQLQGVRLTSWELDTLQAMDAAAMAALNDIRKQDAAPDNRKHP